MSRRKIVVEGVQYSWSYSQPYFHVHPPRGVKGTAANFKVFVGYSDEDGFASAVTPRMVADAIREKVLGLKPVEREYGTVPSIPRPVAKNRSEPTWGTDASLPTTYLVRIVYGRMDGSHGNVPLETHSDPTTAKACAARLDAILVRRGGRGWPKRDLLADATREDILAGVEAGHLRTLEGLMANGELDGIRVEATTLPHRSPVPVRRAA